MEVQKGKWRVEYGECRTQDMGNEKGKKG